MTTWRRGWFIAIATVPVTLLLLGHQHVPNSVGNLGSLVETFLPWLGLGIPVLAAAAIWRRSATAGVAVASAAVVWLALFGQVMLPGKGGGEADLRVVSHNVEDSNPDPRGTAEALLAASPDIIALQELTAGTLAQMSAVLDEHYRYRTAVGTIALWSRHTLVSTEHVDIGLGWTRALRVEVATPGARVAVYVAHLASVRLGSGGFTSGERNETVARFAERVAREKLERVVVLGDFNGTAYDRSLAPLTYRLTSAQAQGGWGFGFTWPAGLPMARIDHILIRGVTATDAWVLPATESDHRPVAADLRL